MPIYKVGYSSMTASYGPAFIEAASEEEAIWKFGGGSFSRSEMSLISAELVSPREMIRALAREEEE